MSDCKAQDSHAESINKMDDSQPAARAHAANFMSFLGPEPGLVICTLRPNASAAGDLILLSKKVHALTKIFVEIQDNIISRPHTGSQICLYT